MGEPVGFGNRADRKRRHARRVGSGAGAALSGVFPSPASAAFFRQNIAAASFARNGRVTPPNTTAAPWDGSRPAAKADDHPPMGPLGFTADEWEQFGKELEEYIEQTGGGLIF